MKIAKKSGFTLVEILVTLSIAAMTFGVVYSLYINYSYQLKGTEEKSILLDNARTKLSMILRDLKNSVKIKEFSGTHIIIEKFNEYEPVKGIEFKTETVKYSLEKDPLKNDKLSIFREANGNKSVFMRADVFAVPLFRGYFYNEAIHKFELFDERENWSEALKKMVLVQVRLDMKKHNKSLSVKTYAALRMNYGVNMDPFWRMNRLK